ncbi:hypothetical protein [Brumimicrobium aurantiacum]|uniref:VCBS repeat-containing protein n=1 Tax=Brumimicrobium aurantiacum TaxID=1737063 RepID=A0A3E1F0Z8_9FLAO|nr:hypothetical protein [Brumimicrobium aurantiacum]RFC55413.1 hypothetical protein DXU93_00315 [Brumimicrobium aurantiacum]
MKIRLFHVLLVTLFSLSIHAQCDTRQLGLLDSLDNEVNSNELFFVFEWEDKLDSVKLTQLYDNEYTKSVSRNFFYSFSQNAIEIDSVGNLSDSSLGLCVVCVKDEIKIIDSIDVNSDGIKEMILFRQWNCTASPPVYQPYGVGTHQQEYGRYEVWDIKKKQQLFEVNNIRKGGVAITTNDGRIYGYHFKVDIDEKGSFILSDLKGVGNKLELGNYIYDDVNERYNIE